MTPGLCKQCQTRLASARFWPYCSSECRDKAEKESSRRRLRRLGQLGVIPQPVEVGPWD